jgi:hypothetical protein
MIIKGVPLAGQPRHVAIRPAWALGLVGNKVKPVQLQVGCWNTYEMPVYNTDDQELFWHLHIPGRWDGASNIGYSLYVALGNAEDVGDKFKFQLQWGWAGPTRAFTATPLENLPVEELVVTGRTAQYSTYKLDFTLDYDVSSPAMATGGILSGRVIRLASGSPAVSNSPLILDHVVNFQIDRAYKA